MSGAPEVPMTDLPERAALTLEGDANAWGAPLRARATITLHAYPHLHPSWTNHILLRVGARLQEAARRELQLLLNEQVPA